MPPPQPLYRDDDDLAILEVLATGQRFTNTCSFKETGVQKPWIRPADFNNLRAQILYEYGNMASGTLLEGLAMRRSLLTTT